MEEKAVTWLEHGIKNRMGEMGGDVFHHLSQVNHLVVKSPESMVQTEQAWKDDYKARRSMKIEERCQ